MLKPDEFRLTRTVTGPDGVGPHFRLLYAGKLVEGGFIFRSDEPLAGMTTAHSSWHGPFSAEDLTDMFDQTELPPAVVGDASSPPTPST